MKKNILLALLVVLLGVAAFGIWQYYHLFVNNLTSRDAEAHRVYVYPDTPMDSVNAQINAAYRVSSPWSLRFHSRLMHFTYARTGSYLLPAKMSDAALIRMLRNGEQTPVEVTFNRIRTREQLAKRLGEQLLLDSVDIISRLEDPSYMGHYGFNKETAVCLFIPDTYELYWTISADALFERMAKEYKHFWNDARKAKAAELKLTQSEVATLASIAESETNKDFEYPIIAGLYLNRLHKGMNLQACPTVIFAWQDFTMRRVLQKHLEIDSPYNTYKYKGLPPGPIRIPRASTMDAVLNYTPSDYLFMCASADFNGTHHFSATYQEHARYAKEYQAALNKRNIK